MNDQLPEVAPEKITQAFEEKMEEITLKQKEKEAAERAAANGLSYINLKGFPISPEALSLISKEQSQKSSVVCFLYSGSAFRIGALNPLDPQIEEIKFNIAERTKAEGELYVISEESLKYAFALYEKLPTPRLIIKGVTVTEEDLKRFGEGFRSFKELEERLRSLNVTDMVAMLIAAALQSRSSDIHIEAGENDVIVRFRIDGVLLVIAHILKVHWLKISSRVKLIAGLKINVADKPQDGRFTIFLAKDKVDVRVSIIPTAFGESIVMRLLRSATVSLGFDHLGLSGPAFERLKREVERPNGMIISTGPTGSGKTTTLYAILNKLNSPEVKIITLEDPVEYRLSGISQSQIDYSHDYTFAKGLRSILRQDPDVVMVGEIRDLETAEIAIQAALTGHLVVSTIHTNSASGAIPRFLSMGAKPFLLSPALNAIIGQRLVRRICPDCKIETTLTDELLSRVKGLLSKISPESGIKVDLENLHFYKGKGCPNCFDLSYKGRVGIYEILNMNPEIEEVILSGKVSEYIIEEIAIRKGMITMAQDGILKALDGMTTIEEVFSVAE